MQSLQVCLAGMPSGVVGGQLLPPAMAGATLYGSYCRMESSTEV